MVLDCHIGMKTLVPIKTREQVWITRECSTLCLVFVPLLFCLTGTSLIIIFGLQYESLFMVELQGPRTSNTGTNTGDGGRDTGTSVQDPQAGGASSDGRGWSSNGLGHHYQLEVCLAVTCDLVRNGATPPSPDIDYE